MPWHVGEQGTHGCDGFPVVKDGTDEVEGCHQTREAANKQVAALYANEPEAGRATAASKTPYGPKSKVTYADPGYQDDGKARYPLDTEAHIHAAWSYINMPKNAAKYSSDEVARIKAKIKSAAKRIGMEISEDNSRSEDLGSLLDVRRAYVRSFPLDDCRIRSGGDGRTVEAYAAVFDVPTEVRDQDGHYSEVIDRAAFNRAISDAAPQGGRQAWRVGVFYNHGRTIYGTPSERGSMPIGTPLEIKADQRGVWTLTRYHRTELADEALEAIREGSLPGYSFQGRFMRSTALDPSGKPLERVPRGGFRASTGGLVTVRRLESSLKEYGPTPFPAYEMAEVVGMRAEYAAHMLDALDPNERSQLIELLRDGALPDAPEDSSDDSPIPDASSDEGPVPDDSPTEDVERSSRESLLQRIAVAKTMRPGLARNPDAERLRERAAAIVGRKGSKP